MLEILEIETFPGFGFEYDVALLEVGHLNELK